MAKYLFKEFIQHSIVTDRMKKNISYQHDNLFSQVNTKKSLTFSKNGAKILSVFGKENPLVNGFPYGVI